MKTKLKFFFDVLLSANLILVMLLSVVPATATAQTPTPANNIVKTPANTPAPASSGYTPDAFNPNVPYAYSGPQASIERLLCTPTLSDANSSAGTNDLTNCINKLYRFGAAIGAFALVTILVIAGYLYILGSEKGKGQAKKYIYSAIAGMAIILTAYLFLSFINPTILQFRTITPPQLVGVKPLPSCAEVGLGQDCVLASGQKALGDGKGGGVVSGQQIQGNGVSCSLGDDNRPNSHAVCHPEYNSVISAAASKYGVEPQMIQTVILQESSWSNRGPSSNPSPGKRAWGLMQVTGDTASANGCSAGASTNSPANDAANIDCGTKVFKRCLTDPRVNGDLKNAFVCYNAGSGSLDPSPICTGLAKYQCPFTNSSKSACQPLQTSSGSWTYKQTRDYAITTIRWYAEYKQAKCI